MGNISNRFVRTLIQTIENFLPDFTGLNYYFYYQAHLCDRSFDINYFQENVLSRGAHDILVSLQTCLFFVRYFFFSSSPLLLVALKTNSCCIFGFKIIQKKVFKYYRITSKALKDSIGILMNLSFLTETLEQTKLDCFFFD